MDHSRASELLGAYAMDACTAAESAFMEHHLEQCAQCAGEAERLIELVAWIGTSLPVAPPPALRCRLLHPANGNRFRTYLPDSPPHTPVGA